MVRRRREGPSFNHLFQTVFAAAVGTGLTLYLSPYFMPRVEPVASSKNTTLLHTESFKLDMWKPRCVPPDERHGKRAGSMSVIFSGVTQTGEAVIIHADQHKNWILSNLREVQGKIQPCADYYGTNSVGLSASFESSVAAEAPPQEGDCIDPYDWFLQLQNKKAKVVWAGRGETGTDIVIVSSDGALNLVESKKTIDGTPDSVCPLFSPLDGGTYSPFSYGI